MPRAYLHKTLIASIASASLVLTSCAAGDNSGRTGSDTGVVDNVETVAISDIAPTERDQIQDGGVLTSSITEISPQQNLFHADATSYTRSVWSWYNPQMAFFDDEGNYEPNPDYLNKVSDELVEGNTVVTYDIVDEATFNDDTPIDWTAFEATWVINNGTDDAYTPSATDGYERIKAVEKGENDKQVKVTFDGAYPWWKGLFNEIAHPALKDPKNYNDYVEKLHPEWGAGPFTVDYVDFNKGEVSFKRNEKWWGDSGKLETRTYRAMEPSAALNAFKSGEIDYVEVGNKPNYDSVKGMGGIDIRVGRRTANSLLTLNAEAPHLKDEKIREAVFKSIDREQINKIIFNGIPYEETPPGSLTLFPMQEGYEDNLSSAATFDPEAAAALLDDAGWALEDGAEYRTKDGEELTVRYTLLGDNEVSRAMAVAIQSMLKSVGMNVQIEERPSSDFSKVVTSYDFDIFPMGFSSTDPFGVAYFGQIYLSDSGLNKSQTGSKEFDQKIRELQELPTAEEQIKRANELEKEAFQFYGLMPLYNGAEMVAVKEDLVNLGAAGLSTISVEDIGWKK